LCETAKKRRLDSCSAKFAAFDAELRPRVLLKYWEYFGLALIVMSCDDKSTLGWVRFRVEKIGEKEVQRTKSMVWKEWGRGFFVGIGVLWGVNG
jgi:hypothetical protein